MSESALIGLQLYTLRDALNADFAGTLQRVADMGYAAVEPYRTIPVPAAEAAHQYQALGFECYSAHVSLPIGDDKNKILDDAAALGVRQIVLGYIDRELFTSTDGVQQVADKLNEAAANARAVGLRFGYHNHHFEFGLLDGRPAYDLLLEWVDDDVVFTLDTYWAQVGGVDPAAYVRRLGDRAPVLHLKDGPADDPQADMVPIGTGAMDTRAIVEAGAGHTRVLVVELDRSQMDMFEAAARSYTYMIDEGLARGRAG